MFYGYYGGWTFLVVALNIRALNRVPECTSQPMHSFPNYDPSYTKKKANKLDSFKGKFGYAVPNKSSHRAQWICEPTEDGNFQFTFQQ